MHRSVFFLTFVTLGILGQISQVKAQNTSVTNSQEQTVVHPSNWMSAGNKTFTGEATVQMAFRQNAPARSYGAYVRFSPGARTFWHEHPLGQTLIVIEGEGLTQAMNSDGTYGPLVTLRKGDIVVCPPNVRHWHGAKPNKAMIHLALSESDQVGSVTWFNPVTDKQYLKEGY